MNNAEHKMLWTTTTAPASLKDDDDDDVDNAAPRGKGWLVRHTVTI